MLIFGIALLASIIINIYLVLTLNKIEDRKTVLTDWDNVIKSFTDLKDSLTTSINQKKEFLDHQNKINEDISRSIEEKKQQLITLQEDVNKSFIEIDVDKENYEKQVAQHKSDLEESIQSIMQKYLNEEKKQQLIMLQEEVNKSFIKIDADKENYEKKVAQHKNELEESLQSIMQKYLNEEIQLSKTIKGYEQKIKAYIEEEKRREEMNSKLDFYRLTLTESEINDVIRLMEFSSSINRPDVLRKLIYKTYFEKQMNDLLGRVVGANSEVSGIYKITHIESKKSYIGQTTNIKDRWRTHLKRGLGIDMPITNKFYSSMMQLKPWNFTWEVIEYCPKEQLNEKEKYWIDFYQTNTWGWNSKGGNR